MELRLVYRILRKISDWAIAGYYSDIDVQGSENVPKKGPVIIVSTHHNEILDIATVAATIPYRRPVSFWAKSTLFEHPLGGPLVSSAGSIPVQRNPDRANGSSAGQAELFKSTSQALANGQVVGVFPEGTSYTQPSIVQVMSGAGWAAVEFAKYQREQGLDQQQDLVIVPLGIVYSDKPSFQSRIFVRYGKPIPMSEYKADLFDSADDIDQASRQTVKKIMEEIESRLVELTINAKDWETLYAANTARDILWRNPDNIPPRDWVPVSQKLIDILGSQDSDPTPAKTALTKYFSLLHHTGLTHASIEHLIPLNVYRHSSSHLSLLRTLLLPSSLRSILTIPISLIKTALFVPPFLVHLPGYIVGNIVYKLLATPGEDEGIAQYKAVGGGISLGLYLAFFGRTIQCTLFNLLVRGWEGLNAERFRECIWGDGVVGGRLLDATGNIREPYSDFLNTLSLIPPKLNGSWLGRMLSLIGFGWFMVKWHGLLVKSNHSRYHRMLARFHLLLGLLQPRRFSLGKSEVDAQGYTRLPPPPTNEFIRRKNQQTQSVAEVEPISVQHPSQIPARKLVLQLLAHKQEASVELGRFLRREGGMEGKRRSDLNWLIEKRAFLPDV